MGLTLRTLDIYRLYIIIIILNTYLLLIIPIVSTPYLQFTATQKIKIAIRTLVDVYFWEYYSRDDDNGDNG